MPNCKFPFVSCVPCSVADLGSAQDPVRQTGLGLGRPLYQVVAIDAVGKRAGQDISQLEKRSRL